MRPNFLLPFVLAAAGYIPSAFAQQVPLPPPPPVYLNLSQQLQNLTDQPGRHAGFTFDKNTMQFAQTVLQANGMDAQRAAAAITGITVDTYQYQQPAFYEPGAMNALLDGYRAAGWKHLVNANQTAANTAQPDHIITDLWLHFNGADVNALTVLTRGPRNMNVLQLTGDLRPLDLLHLGGHFGIPKVDPDAVMVPDNQGQAPPPLQRR